MYCNYDTTSIITPINVKRLQDLLKETRYNEEKSRYIIDGFTNGFDIGYCGPEDRQDRSNNIPLRIGSSIELWNKIMKEVRLGRYAGPFDTIPYNNYIQSPIGLVPKANNKTRLIFHLSYDFGPENHQKSLNYHTPKKLCEVKYRDLDHAVHNCLKLKDTLLHEQFGLFGGKTDLTSAFRLVPLLVRQRRWMIMKATNPMTGKEQFFVDNNMPFGASRSCAIFSEFSDCLMHIVERSYGKKFTITNYLDDYLFIETSRQACNSLVRKFLQICEWINCPVADEKTQMASQEIVFLGILLDLKNYFLAVPEDKAIKAKNMLNFAINKKKITIKNVQSLTGTLNFLNKAIVPGRAFTRRMYSKLEGLQTKNLKQYHHVTLDSEFINDCRMWTSFLEMKNNIALNRPFIDWYGMKGSEILEFYTDASSKIGYGCFFNGMWIAGVWDTIFMQRNKPSIDYLELYALTVAVFAWSRFLTNRRVTIFCDNQGVQGLINKTATKCKNSMKLVRWIVLNNLKNNTKIYVEYIKSGDNTLADSLSRQDFTTFWKNAPKNTNKLPDKVPEELWPLDKIWDD